MQTKPTLGFPCLLLLAAVAGGFTAGLAIVPRPAPRENLAAEAPAPIPLPGNAANPVAPMQRVPFSWASLESTNYEQYASNLRRIECPEPVITAIIHADLAAVLAPKYAALARSTRSLRTAPERSSAQARLEEEIASILYGGLKLPRTPRQVSALFTAEQEGVISEVTQRYPGTANRAARVRTLADTLPPEVFLYYKLDREGDALRIQDLLGGFEPTRDEFLAIAAAGDGNEGVRPWSELKPVIQRILTPERFALLTQMQKPELKAITELGRRLQWSADTVNALYELRQRYAPQDPSYRQQVEATLKLPAVINLYMSQPEIHPELARR